MTHAESGKNIKARIWTEAKLMLWVFAYLFAFLTALAAYRAVLMGAKGAAISAIFQCFIEAFVIAKVMVIGNALKLGERWGQRRRASHILARSLMFTIFTLAFSGAEELIVGLFHGASVGDMFERLREYGLRLLVARGVVLFVFYLPLFLIWEICRLLGEAKAIIVFFGANDEQQTGPSTPLL